MWLVMKHATTNGVYHHWPGSMHLNAWNSIVIWELWCKKRFSVNNRFNMDLIFHFRFSWSLCDCTYIVLFHSFWWIYSVKSDVTSSFPLPSHQMPNRIILFATSKQNNTVLIYTYGATEWLWPRTFILMGLSIHHYAYSQTKCRCGEVLSLTELLGPT